MSDQILPQGPFYIELVFQQDQPTNGEQLASAFIDGFDSETDAWNACRRLGNEEIAAIGADGDDTVVAPSQLLQMLIAKRSTEKFFPVRPV